MFFDQVEFIFLQWWFNSDSCKTHSFMSFIVTESRLWVYTLLSLHIFESNLFESTLFSVEIPTVYTYLSLPYLGIHFFESNLFESTLISVYFFESTRNNTETELFLVYTFSVYTYLSLPYYSLHLFESIFHHLGLNIVYRILSLWNLEIVARTYKW